MEILHIPLRISKDDLDFLMKNCYDNYEEFEEVMVDLMGEYIFDRIKEEE